MGLVGSTSDVVYNTASSNQGHNVMFAPSSSSSLQYVAPIGPPPAGNMQHDTTCALSSSSSMANTVHQGQVMHNTPSMAAPPPSSQPHVAQRGPSREQLGRFLMTASIGQLRQKLWESFHGLSERNKEYRTLQTSLEASEKRREGLEQANSELRKQLDTKTQECENIQTFMNEDFLHAIQADFEPRVEGLKTELSNAGIALNAKTRECEQLRWSNAVLAGLAQQAMPPRRSDREVVEGLTSMSRPDAHEPLPSMLTDTQREEQPAMLMYPASQPSAYEDNEHTHASNEGPQLMTPAGNTYSSPLIDLTSDELETLDQNSGTTTNKSGGRGSTFTSTSSHRSSDASATTINSSVQSSSAPSPQTYSYDPANIGNQLKRGAEIESLGAVKNARRSNYSWLEGSGNPANPSDDWTKVRGGVPQDGRSSYLFNQDNEWEKRKKKYEIRCRKDGVDAKKRPYESIEQKPSVQRATASAQRSEIKKRVPKAKGTRPAPLAASTEGPQIETVEDSVAEAPKTIESRDQEIFKGQTMISDEDDELDAYAAEMEAEMERESEEKVDQATAGQSTGEDDELDAFAAELEAELERASEDKVDEPTVGQFTEAAEAIPDGFLPEDETDRDSLFGDDMGCLSSDDEPEPKHPTGPAIYERPAGPALYYQVVKNGFDEAEIKRDRSVRMDLVKSHNNSFTQEDLLKHRTLVLIVARAHENAWAEMEETPSKNVIHDETSTTTAPAERRDSPVKSRDGKGRVEKAPKKKAAAKKAHQS